MDIALAIFGIVTLGIAIYRNHTKTGRFVKHESRFALVSLLCFVGALLVANTH